MKNQLRIALFLALFSIVLLPGCSHEPVNLSEAETATPELSALSSKTYYNHDGSSDKAQSINLQWNSDGSVTVDRGNVPWTQPNKFVDLVTFNHTDDPLDPNKAVYGPSTVPAWYIPFGDGPIEAIGTPGDKVSLICFCRSFEGYCISFDPGIPPNDGKEVLCASSHNCWSGCMVIISFDFKGDRGPGVCLRATQINEV